MNFGKCIDLIVYHDRVHFCCRKNAVEMIITFNKILPDRYSIYDSELSVLKLFCEKYKLFVLSKYIDDFSSFSEYTNFFSMKERQIFNPNCLEQYYGAVTRETMFFYQTVSDFLYKNKNELRFGNTEIYSEYESPKLSKVGATLHKIYLSTLIIKQMIGMTCYDWEIEYQKKLISDATM